MFLKIDTHNLKDFLANSGASMWSLVKLIGLDDPDFSTLPDENYSPGDQVGILKEFITMMDVLMEWSVARYHILSFRFLAGRYEFEDARKHRNELADRYPRHLYLTFMDTILPKAERRHRLTQGAIALRLGIRANNFLAIQEAFFKMLLDEPTVGDSVDFAALRLEIEPLAQAATQSADRMIRIKAHQVIFHLARTNCELTAEHLKIMYQAFKGMCLEHAGPTEGIEWQAYKKYVTAAEDALGVSLNIRQTLLGESGIAIVSGDQNQAIQSSSPSPAPQMTDLDCEELLPQTAPLSLTDEYRKRMEEEEARLALLEPAGNPVPAGTSSQIEQTALKAAGVVGGNPTE